MEDLNLTCKQYHGSQFLYDGRVWHFQFANDYEMDDNFKLRKVKTKYIYFSPKS